MPGKNNTERIEVLESQAANIVSRLDVHDFQLENIAKALEKWVNSAEGYNSKLTVIEERLVVLVELKNGMLAISTIEKDMVSIKKDLEIIGKWKEELKEE